MVIARDMLYKTGGWRNLREYEDIDLLDQGILEARTNGFHKIVLTMISGNEHARNLYINHGFIGFCFRYFTQY